ncbi:MAG: hypothetical protein EP343_13350 [Deltaproteobacteria bacterium]|nr:MAG: hypothetical protein EP343_13350 [Deltaproteobacteria bacterium]
MNVTIEQMLNEAEGRYLTAEELKQVNEFTASIPKRIAAMKSIERSEERIVAEVINVVWQRHPEFEAKHNYSKAKCTRDVGLVLRYCSMALLRNDTHFLSEKLLVWLRTILNSFEFGNTIDTTYSQLMEASKRHIKGEYYEMLEPYLQLTHHVLTMKDERFE